MPIFIPKPEQQSTFFQSYLEPGESIRGVFWAEQRLSLLMTILIEQLGGMAELLFSKFRHRYFLAITDRRVLILGSTGWHDPIPAKFEALDRANVVCSQYRNWLGHVALDLTVAGEKAPRRFRMPRSQNNAAMGQVARELQAGAPAVAV